MSTESLLALLFLRAFNFKHVLKVAYLRLKHSLLIPHAPLHKPRTNDSAFKNFVCLFVLLFEDMHGQMVYLHVRLIRICIEPFHF